MHEMLIPPYEYRIYRISDELGRYPDRPRIGTENTVLVTNLNGKECRISTEYTVLVVTNPLHCARR